MGKQNATVNFDDHTPMKRINEAKYLGTMLNNIGDPAKELKARISTVVTWTKLDLFWLHSNCSNSFKLQVYNSVIRAKLMYGLESAELTPASRENLNTIQLKGLGNIC